MTFPFPAFRPIALHPVSTTTTATVAVVVSTVVEITGRHYHLRSTVVVATAEDKLVSFQASAEAAVVVT